MLGPGFDPLDLLPGGVVDVAAQEALQCQKRPTTVSKETYY